MNRRFFLLGLVVLTACARPLSPNEDAFAAALFGDSLDREAVTVRVGIGLTPLPRPEAPRADAPPPRSVPDGFCTRIPQPRQGFTWPAAFVLWNDIFFSSKFYAADTFAGWPLSLPLPQFLIMAHELVHVWQWQNRDRTAYRPIDSAAESGEGIDPYYWQAEAGQAFLSYGFEQQAAMVEDFLCFRLFEPDHARVEELRAIINPVIPLDGLEAALVK